MSHSIGVYIPLGKAVRQTKGRRFNPGNVFWGYCLWPDLTRECPAFFASLEWVDSMGFCDRSLVDFHACWHIAASYDQTRNKGTVMVRITLPSIVDIGKV